MAIKKLVGFSIIFTIISVALFFLLNIRYENKHARYVKAHEAIQATTRDIDVVAFTHPEYGDVYKISDLNTPVGKLESYYWNENYCLKGKLQESQYSWEEHLNWLLVTADENMNYYKEIVANNDTVYYLRKEHPDTTKVESYLFNYKSNLGSRVFGWNNTIEESIEIGLLLLYEKPVDYRIIREEKVDRKGES